MDVKKTDEKKQKVIVMSASRYKMVDAGTGEINEGVTVRYLTTEKLDPFQEGDLKGYRFGKTTIPYDEFNTLKIVPGIFACDFDFKIKSDGTVQALAKDFEYVGPVVLPAAK